MKKQSRDSTSTLFESFSGIDLTTLNIFKEKCGTDFIFFETFCEDLTYLIRSIYRSQTSSYKTEEVIESIIIFIRLRTGKSLLSLSCETLSKCGKLGEIVLDLIETLASYTHGDNLKTQSIDSFSDNVDSIYDIFNKFTSLKDTKIYQKTHRLIMYFLSMGFCDIINIKMTDIGYTCLEANMLKQKYKFGPTFIVTLIDTCLYILKKGIQIIKTGDVNCIYHSGETYGAVYDDYLILKKQTPQLHNPELFGFNLSSHQSLLDNTIEKYQNIKKHSGSMSKFDKDNTIKILNELEFWRTELITKKSSRNLRKSPFSVLFFGESGVGKTYLKEILFNFYGKVMNLDTKSDFCFTRSPGANFWDGFRSSMWCVVLDDVGFPHPNKCPNGDETFKDMIQIQNNQPFCPDQAALEDKGKTPMLARLLIATTNIKNLNAAQYFTHASAVQRRLPIVITPTVKPEFAKSDGMLDRSKLPPRVSGEYDDYWTFDVDIVEAVLTTSTEKYANYNRILDNCSLLQLLQFLKKAIDDHEEGQIKFMNAVSDMNNIELCPICFLPTMQFCKCDPIKVQLMKQVLQDRNVNIIKPISNLWIDLKQYISRYTSNKLFPDEDIFKLKLVEQMEKEFPVQHTQQSSLELHLTIIGYLSLFTFICYNMIMFKLGNVRRDVDTLRRTMYYPTLFFKFIGECKTYLFGFHPTTREYWVNLGLNQQRRLVGLSTHIKLISIITAISSVGVIISLYNKFSKKKQHYQQMTNVELDAIGIKPKPRDDERHNPWIKEDIHLSKFELTPQITSNKSDNLEVFNERVARNCIFIKTSLPGNKGLRKARAVCLRGNMYITNDHNIPPLDQFSYITITQSVVTNGVTNNVTAKLSESDVIRIPDRDLCIVTLTCICPKKGIFELLPKKRVNTICNGTYIIREENGCITYKDLHKIQLRKEYKYIDVDNIVNTISNVWTATCPMSTIDGECGSPMIVNTPMGKFVGGIHVLGKEGSMNVVSHAIFREDFEDILKVNSMCSMQSDDPKISAPGFIRDLGELHRKANIRFLESGSADIYGSFNDFRSAPRSTVDISPLANHLSPHGYKIKYGKPEMTSWEPWNLALQDLTNPLQNFDSDVLNIIGQSFMDDIDLRANVDQLSEVCVVDLFTAINGAEGVSYIDKINRNTSAGAPWKRAKKNFMFDIPSQHGLQDPVDIDDNIKMRCANIIENYHNNKRSNCIYTAHLKDEAVSFAKMRAKKTRVFSSSPMDQTLVTRMYTVGLVRYIQNNKSIFESAPGMVAQSHEWKLLYDYVTRFGTDRIIAGDYRKFDKTMPAKFILKAFEILKHVCETSCNYTDKDLKVIDGIAIDTAYAMTDFNGDLIQFFGSNPSGHALTVIINGLVNSLYMRYAYYLLNPNRESKSFRDNVNLVTYGDDNLMGVNILCPWFNHTSISKLFAIYGLGYTMADKDAESRPYIHISEASFLKRGFKLDNDTNFCMAPIEHESIEKSLMVWTYSKSVCPAKQAISVVSSALREYFFYGKIIFEEKRLLLQKIVIEAGYELWIEESTFPEWEDLVQTYRDASIGSKF